MRSDLKISCFKSKHQSLRAVVLTALIALFLSAFAGAAMAQDINGGTSWGGWTSKGLSNQVGVYAGSTDDSGSATGGATPTEVFEIYTTTFLYSTGNPIPGTVGEGGFVNGHTILGIGVRRISSTDMGTFHSVITWDIDGADFRPASTLTATDGTSNTPNMQFGELFTHVLNGCAPSETQVFNGAHVVSGTYGCGNGLPGVRGLSAGAASYQVFYDLTQMPVLYGPGGTHVVGGDTPLTALNPNLKIGVIVANSSFSSKSMVVINASLGVTRYVDTDGQAGPSGCGESTAAFTTIGAAVAAANAGDTINVCAGTYNENLTLTKAVFLLGPNANVDPNTGSRVAEAIINGGGGTAIIPQAPGILINGFTVSTTAAGFPIYTGGTDVTGLTISNDIFGSGVRAVTVATSGSDISILHNQINGAGYGIHFGGGTYANVKINNNVVSGPVVYYAIFISGTGSIAGFELKDNKIYDTVNIAANTSNATVSGNIFDAPTVSGLDVQIDLHNSTVNANTFEGHNANACLQLFGSQYGLVPSDHVTVSGNNFNNCGAAGTWTFAVQLSTDIHHINITQNTILNSFDGVNTRDSTAWDLTGKEIHINFNRIIGSTNYGVRNGQSGTLDAENNWWGCNSGPGGATGGGCAVAPNGVGGAGAGSVDANPWLKLTTSAATPTVVVGGTDLVTSLLTTNSDNLTPAGGSVPNNTQASFVGTFGTVLPNPNTFTSGSTTTTFTGTAQGVGGVATTVDGQTVSAPIAVYNNACVAVSIPSNITTLRNVPVTVPINVDLLTGRNVLGYATTITYDSSKLTFNGVDKTGTLSSGFDVTVDTATTNKIKLFAFTLGTAPSGAGTLLKLNFTSSPGAISAVPTAVSFDSFFFNEENTPPCSSTSNGSVKIISGDITGRVTYALNGSNGVPNASMFADGTPDDVTTNTDYTVGTPATWGNYTLTGLGPGDYVVTPSKAPQAPGNTNGISPLDASCIAQWGVGQTCSAGSVPLSGTPLFRAADVTKNGTLSPLDAAYIAQFSVGISNPSFAGTWEFIASNTSYTAAQVETGMSGQDYTAILLGDVTGNWNPALLGGARPALADDLLSESRDAVTATVPGITALHEDLFESRDAITATAPDIKAVAGSSVIVPIDIQGLKGKGVTAYQFDLIYDPKVMEPQKVAADIAGTISDGMNVVFNSAEPGLLKVAVYGIAPVNGQGVLVNLRFSAVGEVGSSTELRLGGLMLNEGGFKVHLAAGQLTIAAASQGTIRGRVLTALGIGIAGARVTVTSTTGETHTVVSGAFGYYEFGGLQLSETYTITVSHKRYSFVPQSVVIADALTNQDMIAKQ